VSRRSPRMLRAAGGGLAIVLVVLAPRPAGAQCDASVKPAPGEVGYKKRPYACEGMYVGLQSAPVGVQVVSLVRGTLSYARDSRADSVLYIKARHSITHLHPQVRVIGRARQANLHWALDGSVGASSEMRWDLGSVVKPMKLDSTKIGVYGLAARRGPDSLGGPVFVPLEVTRHRQAATTNTVVELIVRVPLAAELCWSLAQGDSAQIFARAARCESAIPPIDGNADGYFRIPLVRPPAGDHRLAIRWRPRGSRAFGKPVHLSIHIW
jgi:hypothetical protein